MREASVHPIVLLNQRLVSVPVWTVHSIRSSSNNVMRVLFEKKLTYVDNVEPVVATHTMTDDSVTAAGKTEEMPQEEMHGNNMGTLHNIRTDDAENISSTSQPALGKKKGFIHPKKLQMIMSNLPPQKPNQRQ